VIRSLSLSCGFRQDVIYFVRPPEERDVGDIPPRPEEHRRQCGGKNMLQRENLLARLKQQYNTMSKGQKRLTDYIISHYDKAAFMTAARLGREVGVSESTAVRFAIQMGYEGFPEFHEALKELVMTRLNSIQRIAVTSDRIPQARILDTVLQSDIEKIKLTLEQTDREIFRQAVETILAADAIYVVGVRSCAPLASFLGYYLNQIFGNVRLVTTSGATEVYEQIIRISEKDVIIGISFPRYSMRTLKAMEYANARNAKVITITDSVHSPMNLYSSCNLIARSDMVSIVDSLVAPLSLINALLAALCMKRQKEVMHTLETMEKVWDEYEVFSGDEFDYLGDRMKRQIRKTGEKDE
jgi:DNA-binding MurR/RpiR family transcriptional regulator